MPININQHISNLEFNHETYQSVFDAADKVFLSSKSLPAIAALSRNAPPPPKQPHPGQSIVAGENSALNTGFRETQPPEATVAAVSKPQKPKKDKNKENKPQNNQNSNRNQKPRRGPRHSSNPPHNSCNNHFTHGDQSWFCSAPLTCPWKDKVVERPA